MLKQNIKIDAVPVSGGLALGEAQVMRDPLIQIARRNIPRARIKEEIARLELASAKTLEEFKATKDRAVKAIGEQGANVFDAQVMVASDEQFMNSVIDRITNEKVNAEYAYQEMLADTIERLNRAKDPYLRQMVYDIKSVSERVLSLLLGVGDGEQAGFDSPTILVGRIFSPAQVMEYAKRNVVGFLTQEGGPNSHMGLIVRSMGIPAVMGQFRIGEDLISGIPLIVDGNNGELIINPNSETWRNYRRIRTRKHSQPFAVLRIAKSIKNRCRDGREIKMAANLEIPGPLDEHLIRLGIGVGLYRTEFLYFTRQSFPDEEEQFQVYSKIAREFNPLPVTLRTFDLGGDKYTNQIGKTSEDNPALGWRGVRVALDSTDLYKSQIRAILRASAVGNLRLMLPMVSDSADVVSSLELIDKVKRELKRSREPFDEDIKIGIMIEVPSAALLADYLAEMVDFFSIGTNDLIQYTMAADRGNHRVSKYYMAHHPSVLKLIQRTIHAAHDNGIPVTVCGEMAGTKTMAPLLVGLGVDELSMNPTLLPGVSDWISRFNYIDAKKFASRVMRLTNAEKVARAIREAYEYIRRQKKGTWISGQSRQS
jgi:phosphotransferase system enzyme I (PtsI)